MAHDAVNAGFEKWVVFEKTRAANRMCHIQAYQALEAVMVQRFDRPIRMLDIGCGDAAEVSRILATANLTEYVGIDNASEVLTSARSHLKERQACPWQLICADYADALARVQGPFDLIWLGLFLHHLSGARKQAFFKHAADLLADGGGVVCHDPVLREGEDRSGFIHRISQACRSWPELSKSEREVMAHHWSRNGRQETIGRLAAFAGAAGFSQPEVLWRDPDDFYAVMAFWC